MNYKSLKRWRMVITDLLNYNTRLTQGMSYDECYRIYGLDTDRMQCEECEFYFYESDLRYTEDYETGAFSGEPTCVWCLENE